MTCREFIEFLWQYASEELTAGERSEFDAHLAICPHCVAYLDGYLKTIHLAKEAAAPGPDDAVPEDAPAELIEAILAARRKAR